MPSSYGRFHCNNEYVVSIQSPLQRAFFYLFLLRVGTGLSRFVISLLCISLELQQKYKAFIIRNFDNHLCQALAFFGWICEQISLSCTKLSITLIDNCAEEKITEYYSIFMF